MRKLLRILFILLTIYLVSSVAIGIFLMEFSTQRSRRPITAADRQLVDAHLQKLGAHISDVKVVIPDHVTLRGWYIEPASPNGSSVVLLHGVTDNRLGVAGFGELFLHHGYSILLPDARAHGESDGSRITYGLLEARDVQDWVNWLEAEHNPACVYGFGESLGAAIILQSLRYEKRFCAVVAESPFSDFKEAAYDRVGGRFGLGPWFGETLMRPAIEVGIWYARWRYNLDFRQASPRLAAAQSATPTLLIHGLDDVNIYPRNSRVIHEANLQNSELWEVPHAAHCGAWSADPEKFNKKIIGWFAGNNQAPTSASKSN